jgi:aspartate carbamoyltransferase catalytic subunit
MAGKNLLYKRNLLSVLDLTSKQEIIQILDLAKSFRDDIREGRNVQPLLQGHGMVQMFFEVRSLLTIFI